jgi:hypothetical protein
MAASDEMKQYTVLLISTLAEAFSEEELDIEREGWYIDPKK